MGGGGDAENLLQLYLIANQRQNGRVNMQEMYTSLTYLIPKLYPPDRVNQPKLNYFGNKLVNRLSIGYSSVIVADIPTLLQNIKLLPNREDQLYQSADSARRMMYQFELIELKKFCDRCLLGNKSAMLPFKVGFIMRTNSDAQTISDRGILASRPRNAREKVKDIELEHSDYDWLFFVHGVKVEGGNTTSSPATNIYIPLEKGGESLCVQDIDLGSPDQAFHVLDKDLLDLSLQVGAGLGNMAFYMTPEQRKSTFEIN
jgi:hypothetical protein